MMRPHVALICFDNPFLKPMEGGKRAMLSRIHALQGLDIDLDVYLLNKRAEGIADLSPIAQDDRFILRQFRMRPTRPGMALSRYPICVCKRYVDALKAELTRHHYDVAIYEGEHVSPYRLNECVHAEKHVLYYHDIESEYRAQLSSSQKTLIARALQKNESRKFSTLEKRLPDAFDEHLFVSCDELDSFSARYGFGDRTKYAPYAVEDISGSVCLDVVPGRILYIGDLTLDSNYSSVEWFVREVLPKVACDLCDVEFRVIGRIDEEKRAALCSIDERVNVLGYVDDINSEYSNAACMVSPILYGAGVKIKLIDALAHGQIVVANSKACEGTRLLDGDNLLVGDSPDDFAVLCNGVLNHRTDYVQVARNGLKFVTENHSIDAHRRLLAEVIYG